MKPVIENVEVVEIGEFAKIRITGKRFNGGKVVFRQGEYAVTVPTPPTSDTSFTVEIPRGFIASLMHVRVQHPKYGLSNLAYLRPVGGLGAVASTGFAATFFQTNTFSNELVRKFVLDGGFDTVFTPDLTRAYVSTGDRVVVIDALAMRRADLDPTTLDIDDSIKIDGNPFIHQMAMDPSGHFLFVAGEAQVVWVIDLRPRSDTYHKVLRTIVLPRERIANSGISVTADGKHLLVSTGTTNDEGHLTIFKLIPDKEPETGNLAPGGWGAQEHDVTLEGIPFSITASPDPTQPGFAAFTYRYGVTHYSPWSDSSQPNMVRIGTVKLDAVTPPTIGEVITKVEGGDLDLFAEDNYNGYYTNILTPRDVVLAPDLSYAYIADWELHLIFEVGGQYGDKVGLVRDPFGLKGTPKYLGATTPIEDGEANTVALNGDGSRLFAGYAGVGEVLVIDTAQLIKAGELLASNPFVAERTPLDQVPNINVHITPLTVGGQLQGMSTQGLPTLTISDASGDDSRDTVFQDGALRISYDLTGAGGTLQSVTLELLKNGKFEGDLGTFAGPLASNKLINLNGLSPAPAPGQYQVRARGTLAGGGMVESIKVALTVLDSSVKKAGTWMSDIFIYGIAGTVASNTATVYYGAGGTDSLHFPGFDLGQVMSLNGEPLSNYKPSVALPRSGLSVENQAIYRGSSFDYLRLDNGREIYFQGIEELVFDGLTLELQAHPNDPQFATQWNLVVTDVPDAWRFSTGSENVVIVSLDGGLRQAPTGTDDLAGSDRLVTSATSIVSPDDHGHNAVSVMSSTANNGSNVTGINWVSPVFVSNVYVGDGGVNLQQGITDALAFAAAYKADRVVFQGGVQGESWLTDGPATGVPTPDGGWTPAKLQQQLEDLIGINSGDKTLYAIAAANGGPGGGFNDSDPGAPNYLSGVSGVARLQTSHSNVIAVGALDHTATTVSGLQNANTVFIRASSNRGPDLTLVAPTLNPATNTNGTINLFGGTSAANPHMAGVASLVWSVNTVLKAGDLRQILIDTAMDLVDNNLATAPAPAGPAGLGRDNTFGYGLVDAGAAVRRAYALKMIPDVAMLYAANAFLLDPALPTPLGPLNPSPYAIPPSEPAPPPPDGPQGGDGDPQPGPGMPLQNGSFTVDDPLNSAYGWNTLGGAGVQNGTAVLTEDARFTSRFSQTFDIPAGAISLQFTIQSAAFDDDLSGPPDAFEVALLNDQTGQSLIGTAQGLSLTDALLNIQADRTTYFGGRVTVTGAPTSGALGDYTQPQTVVVDLSGITAHTTATLYFDLLGFGATSSQVVIDDVMIVTGAGSEPTNLDLSDSEVVENVVAASIGTLTVTDPDVGDSHSFTLSDNRFEVAGATLKLKSGVSLDYEAGQTVPLTITATDSTGLSISRLFTITVLDVNLPPTADFVGDAAVNEGSTASVAFSNQVDSEGVATTAGFAYSFDFDNDGNFEISGSSLASAMVPASFLADGAGNLTVRGRIVDQHGLHTDYTTVIEIENVAPTLALAGAPQVQLGSPYVLTLGDVTDPGDDTVTAFVVHWGDGMFDSYSTRGDVPHTYSDGPGSHTIAVDLMDEDGEYLGVASLTVQVNSISVVAAKDDGEWGYRERGIWHDGDSALASIPGDANGDQQVDIFDINMIAANWGWRVDQEGAHSTCDADVNHDGIVDVFDINTVSANWGLAASGQAEPDLGWRGDYRYYDSGDGTHTATWTLQVTPGEYEVFSTWVAGEEHATDATYTIMDGIRIVDQVTHDQRSSPSGAIYDGRGWASLGIHQFSSGVISIVLSDRADGIVVADAILVAQLSINELLKRAGAGYSGQSARGSQPGRRGRRHRRRSRRSQLGQCGTCRRCQRRWRCGHLRCQLD